jgi:eukaryotic-like serine/threonine-protein kinase
LAPTKSCPLSAQAGWAKSTRPATRLDRTVAIKILPAALASDEQFRERFDREARAISHLDHPHICTLYDVGEQDGTAFLVMQYLEGETLADRLTRGALPLAEALQFAIQIAGALDKAHRAGIVHRDLKPGNIMLTKGAATLLDFGLAKSGRPLVAGAGLSMLPTTPPNLTALGAILGTFQYMAPEQLEGHEADARTDIFAFGAVLHEMVTGRKAFEGKSQVSLIGAILERDPAPVSSLQPASPPTLDAVIKRCLAKDPDDRWQSAADLGVPLKWIETPAATATSTTVGFHPAKDDGRCRRTEACFLDGGATARRSFSSADPASAARTRDSRRFPSSRPERRSNRAPLMSSSTRGTSISRTSV